ncbi:hypothetical protein LOD99_8009 [Oopsacas minuta]|uniref:Uncharacterized protein n=1 Tax=Oopsacas minuta TaxID=111878 RepID=A0AAV7JIQ1_9METZ|nr:hypothetical protein LOD99_8009 [Oopsacas minuta]
MYNDILSKVNSCHECQQQNQFKKGPSELHPVNIPDRSFSKWGMDLIGPLTATVEGNSYIIVLLNISLVGQRPRALSFVITGEEDQQSAIPKYVSDFMELKGKEIGGKNPKDYLEDSKMRKDGMWGL